MTRIKPAGASKERAGLKYVSCSPFRVPIARVAAGKAALDNAKK